jgi:hypothetical protein
MMGALRQRPDTQEAEKRVDQLKPRPHRPRVLGGLDRTASCLIAAVVALHAPPRRRQRRDPRRSMLIYASPQSPLVSPPASRSYLLHTTAFVTPLGPAPPANL